SQIKALERIYRRRLGKDELIGRELARYMATLSRDIGRQIGVLIDRAGRVVSVILGDEREIVIPILADYPLGRRALRGIRCIHTHLKDEPLSKDDLTDLALLRLDAMVAIGVNEDATPSTIYTAHLRPLAPPETNGDTEGELYEVLAPEPMSTLEKNAIDFKEFITALEGELGRITTTSTDDKRERAILVSVALKSSSEQARSLKELEALAVTSDIVVLTSLSQRPKKLNPKYLMGTGKIKELVIEALQRRATLIVFNQELSPTQLRELGNITELKVIDRTQLILDIFAKRALSKDGRVQVELAQLKYLLPKLSGKGTTMSRLMGGIGGRGPGETKLEIDRRRVTERISRLEKELKHISKGRTERRRRRAESGVPIISIVGYTNAGKSTLLNALTQSTTLAEDKLFATLDTATRRLRFPRERDAVITDTVGFIKNLPKDLMKAFSATLEEMQDADLLIHLVDVSDPDFEDHLETVDKILKEIGLSDIECLLVFNKADRLEGELAENLATRHHALSVSATERATLKALLKILGDKLWPNEDEEEWSS
ncbi:MAG: GTPase HflX, partial [Deltaproteobacteria bacterium]|nr:GTPase HflX [Deltaproteobacteria bacterium]